MIEFSRATLIFYVISFCQVAYSQGSAIKLTADEARYFSNVFGLKSGSYGGPISTNAFSENPSVQTRLWFNRSIYPSLYWFAQIQIGIDGVTMTERDHVLKLLKLSTEDIRKVDSLFSKRLSDHETNKKVLKGADIRENELAKVERGLPERYSKTVFYKELSKLEIDKAFAEFTSLELESEKTLVRELELVVDPDDFQTIAFRWIKAQRLYTPIAIAYLELSEEQTRSIELACLALLRKEQELKVAKSAKDASSNVNSTSSDELYEAKLRTLSYLKPRQFRKIAELFLHPWHSCRTFSERIDKISKAEDRRDQIELKVLGELYLQGAKIENL